MLRSLTLILLIGTTTLAEAFFCLSFDGSSANRTRSYRHARTAPPAIPYWLPPARFPRFKQPTSVKNDIPSIIPVKASPEIIEGYRFRPTGGQTGKPGRWPANNH